ncbi:MAG: TlpA disulfide reductase family protein [Gammaproteobacteria bacterium]|jgi:thiol-disulfide isomerase/thioredoxin|nr:TlpA disulfide reductase family protein [Gammaproteobacteria bacterium]
MPKWIRIALLACVLVSCTVIGARFYLELSRPPPAVATGQVSGTPEQLPDFTLNDVYGEPRAISEWSGEPLLLNFWATWCAPCRREIPLLQALHTSGELRVVGVAIDRQADVETFIAEFGVAYPNLVGQEDAMRVSDLFGLNGLGLPFSVLAGGDGAVLTVHIGELDAGQLEELVRTSRDYTAGRTDLAGARQRLSAL